MEMADEGITNDDVRRAIIEGSLKARQTRDPRGTRYVFLGPAMDGRQIEVVCRLIPDVVRIVTVYRIE